MRRVSTIAVFLGFCAGVASADTLYGGNANRVGATSGNLIAIDQLTGAGTFLGAGANPRGLSGIVFDGAGNLWGTTICTGCTSTLVQLDPVTGTVLNTVGNIGISIGDLAYDPQNGLLYGIRSNAAGGGGLLYTIDTATAVATFVGNTGTNVGGGLAFAPDGTLYNSTTSLNVLNPATGAIISSVPLGSYFDGLAVRSDGTIFATPGNSDGVFILNPITGNSTLIGHTGTGNLSDLAFLNSIPEPSTMALIGLGLVGLGAFRKRR